MQGSFSCATPPVCKIDAPTDLWAVHILEWEGRIHDGDNDIGNPACYFFGLVRARTSSIERKRYKISESLQVTYKSLKVVFDSAAKISTFHSSAFLLVIVIQIVHGSINFFDFVAFLLEQVKKSKSFWTFSRWITNVSQGRCSGYGSAPLTVSVYNFDPSLLRRRESDIPTMFASCFVQLLRLLYRGSVHRRPHTSIWC
jgi:hypothetical protein